MCATCRAQGVGQCDECAGPTWAADDEGNEQNLWQIDGREVCGECADFCNCEDGSVYRLVSYETAARLLSSRPLEADWEGEFQALVATFGFAPGTPIACYGCERCRSVSFRDAQS